jgi:UDP-glucuronate decarboxylase
MNILVTGGAGFIGSTLCKKLLESNNKVVCIDNYYSGTPENLQDLLGNKNFTFINHDVIDPIAFDHAVDQIYHLACPASPPVYQIDPIFTIKTNVLGTMNALNLSVNHNATILLASTSEIYGDPDVNTQPDEYWGNVNPIGIRSCYAEGKRIAETLMMEYHRKYMTNVRIARIFNTYGPRMRLDDGRVVSNFINQCLRNEDITIYGDGTQTRSLCYVDDTVDGLIKLMNNKTTIGPINIGNPEKEITVNRLAETILNKTGATSSFVYLNLPQDDPRKRRPDITKANNILNWYPLINLEEGLDRTIEYFRFRRIVQEGDRH